MATDQGRDGFAEVASAYQGLRQPYPDDLFRVLRGLCAGPREALVADIGAGTGLVASAMAAHYSCTVAIEPSAAMVRGRSTTTAHWVVARAESLPLTSRSAQLLTVGQAFHWFDAEPFLNEAIRVLRPGGALAVFWEGPAADEPYRALVHRHLNELLRESDARAHPGAMTSAREWVLERLAKAGFSQVHKEVIRFDRMWTLEAFAGFMSSMSRVGKLDEAARSRFSTGVRRLFHESGLPEAFHERNEVELFIGRTSRSS